MLERRTILTCRGCDHRGCDDFALVDVEFDRDHFFQPRTGVCLACAWDASWEPLELQIMGMDQLEAARG